MEAKPLTALSKTLATVLRNLLTVIFLIFLTPMIKGGLQLVKSCHVDAIHPHESAIIGNFPRDVNGSYIFLLAILEVSLIKIFSV